jgi:hypothetical protein
MGKTRNAYKILMRKPIKTCTWKTEKGVRITLKLILGREVMRIRSGSKWLRIVSTG